MNNGHKGFEPGAMALFMAMHEAGSNIWRQLQDHAQIGPLLAKDGRAGVILRAAPISNPSMQFTLPIGEPNPDKRAGYDRFAGEKINRLATHPTHRASSESRRPVEERYGGAVKGGSFFWSISGLWPDALDELLAVLTAVEIGDMALVEAQGLLKHTGNEYVALIGSFKFKSL
ncbi:MAG TPA: hypothetical protein VF439_03005 [Candidatus Paceibacterota bacterium]